MFANVDRSAAQIDQDLQRQDHAEDMNFDAIIFPGETNFARDSRSFRDRDNGAR
jgi:hypothetical protein